MKVKITVVHYPPLVIINAVIGWIYFVAWSVSFYRRFSPRWGIMLIKCSANAGYAAISVVDFQNSPGECSRTLLDDPPLTSILSPPTMPHLGEPCRLILSWTLSALNMLYSCMTYCWILLKVSEICTAVILCKQGGRILFYISINCSVCMVIWFILNTKQVIEQG